MTDQNQTHTDWCKTKKNGRCGGLFRFAGLRPTLFAPGAGMMRADRLARAELGDDALECRVVERALFFIDGPNWREWKEAGYPRAAEPPVSIEDRVKAVEQRWASA